MSHSGSEEITRCLTSSVIRAEMNNMGQDRTGQYNRSQCTGSNDKYYFVKLVSIIYELYIYGLFIYRLLCNVFLTWGHSEKKSETHF